MTSIQPLLHETILLLQSESDELGSSFYLLDSKVLILFFFFSPSLYLINVAYQCALIVNEPHSRMEGVFQETVALYYVCFPYLKDEDKMMLSCLHIEIL